MTRLLLLALTAIAFVAGCVEPNTPFDATLDADAAAPIDALDASVTP